MEKDLKKIIDESINELLDKLKNDLSVGDAIGESYTSTATWKESEDKSYVLLYKIALKFPNGDVKIAQDGETSHEQIYNRLLKQGYNNLISRHDPDVEDGWVDSEGVFISRDDASKQLGYKADTFSKSNFLDETISEESYRVYNNTLCPVLWDDHQHLDPKTRVNLLRMAYDFYEKTGFKAPIIDVYLMGSIANFNWNEESDTDVHVMIDYSQLQMPEETIKEIIRTVGSQWNAEHNATVKGHKVELNLQNIKEQKPHVTGIYSLTKDTWIRQPVYQNVQIDKMLIQTKYKGMKKYIEAVINSGDEEAMKQAKKYIDAFRQYGLDTKGELSTENIVFKILRSKGLLKMLKDAIISIYDKEMSVKEVTMKDLKSRHPQLPTVVSHNNIPWDKLTLDNLKALKEKAGRTYEYFKNRKFEMTPEEEKYLGSTMQFYYKINQEIKKRLKYINDPVKEGYGAGIPSQDRLNIPGNRWQIRSKDAPKTPKMTEHVYEPPKVKSPSKITLNKPNRIDLFPKSFGDSYPIVNELLLCITTILDKKNKKGVKEFSSDYIDDLIDDTFYYNIKVPLDKDTLSSLKNWIKNTIKMDYKII